MPNTANKPPEEVLFIVKAAKTPNSLDGELQEELTLLDSVEDKVEDKSFNPMDKLLEQEKPQRIAELFQDLNPQEQKILILRAWPEFLTPKSKKSCLSSWIKPTTDSPTANKSTR